MGSIPPIQSFEEFEAATVSLITPAYKSRFGRVRWGDLDAPAPEHEYIIDGFLSAGDKSIIGGPSGSGKSFLAIHAGLSIALGRDFFGHKVMTPGLVIYQAGEGARGVRKRLRAYRDHFGVDQPVVPFELLQSRVDLYRPDGDTEAFIAECKAIALEYELPLVAIFIDTLATAQGAADENSGKDMAAVLNNIDRIQRETHAHVCLVHHMNADGKKLRGHTSIKANVDQVIVVTKDEATKVRTATLDKQKDDEDGVNIRFELLSVETGRRPDGKAITSCVCLPVGEKAAMQADAERRGFKVNAGEAAFLRALFAALDAKGQAPPANCAAPGSVAHVVDYSEVKRVFATQNPPDGLDSAADPEEAAQALARHREMLKKKLARAREKLQQFGVIGADAPFIWHGGKPIAGFPRTFPKPPREPEPLGIDEADLEELPF